MKRLIRFGACAAIVGGGLRIVSTAIPYHPNSAMLELFYSIIDTGFLFGLLAAYLAESGAIGRLGFAGFVVAVTGVASILGPTSLAYYYTGATIFVAGLAVFAVSLLRQSVQRAAATLWLGSALAGFGFSLSEYTAAFTTAGIMLGLGFVVCGVAIFREHPVFNQERS